MTLSTLRLLAGTLVLLMPVPGLAADFYVNNPGDFVDSNPGDGVCLGGSPIMACGLRAAIMEANAVGGHGTIHLPPGHYRLTRVGRDEDLGYSGDLDLRASWSIEGSGADITVIDAQGIDRVFDIQTTSTTQIEGVTITGGVVAGEGLSGSGGGILALADMNLVFVRIDGNRATEGGGVYSSGSGNSVFMSHSVIANNTVEPYILSQGGSVLPSGGGIKAVSGSSWIFDYSAVVSNRCGSGNAAGCDGAAGATFTNAGPPAGWALFAVDSTVSDNLPGGVWLDDSNAVVARCTVADNPGGGLTLVETARSTSLDVSFSIISNNEPDCNVIPGSTGTWTLAGQSNLDSDWTCGLDLQSGDLPGLDPELHPLGHFDPPAGYVAPSRHPKWGSPVVDRVPGSSTWDQDGYPRPQDGDGEPGAYDDLGAIEALSCVSPDPDVYLDHVLLLPPPPLTELVIEACRTIHTGTAVSVQSGGTVRFVARDSIAIGNGFSVLEGAAFVAGFARTAWAP